MAHCASLPILTLPSLSHKNKESSNLSFPCLNWALGLGPSSAALNLLGHAFMSGSESRQLCLVAVPPVVA
ncbi:hypothetical protein CTA1_9867 [Colletotrichum tanaceti]|uniref:Uncharacterized protein n=1 Tax=Colletotrichum tanaceti TaxID=1306861 RepID=A0A4U6XJS3_9PEZI|nr:hypothetical protein CTA1_9867 [Colletotrichum tanaceti]